MVVDYIRIIELKEKGFPVPPNLLQFCDDCMSLVQYAADCGKTKEDALEAFKEAVGTEGGRAAVFARARDILCDAHVVRS